MIRHKIVFSDEKCVGIDDTFEVFDEIPFKLQIGDKILPSDLIGYDELKFWLEKRNIKFTEFEVTISYICKDEKGFYVWIQLNETK